MKSQLRSDIPEPPARIKLLPIDERGYPVPFFVSWVDGKPEFRLADPKKLIRCLNEKLCWVCGQKLSKRAGTFVIGPMCAINRISAEPPSHLECAEYSAKSCPFITKPQMVRREDNLPDATKDPAGIMIKRNPGVILLWTTDYYEITEAGNGILIIMGEPVEIPSAWTQGRLATKEETAESIRTGLPSLLKLAKRQGDEALQELEVGLKQALEILEIPGTVTMPVIPPGMILA